MTKNKYTRSMAISLVVANMIGTGVFTALGFQIGDLGSPFVILVLWLLGGVIALSGAFAYAEVGTLIKGSGGEYNYLSRIYHPALGFLSGWMSIFVGFAGAIGAVAIAIGEYFSPVLGDFSPQWIAIISIVLFALVHITGVRSGGWTQNFLTWFKIGLILFFIAAPFFVGDFNPSTENFGPQEGDWDIILSSTFAISIAWIMYSYSGWNASTYIAGVLENPKKNLPYSLIIGAAIVTVMYLGLNAMFMYVGYDAILAKGAYEVDVGVTASEVLFGSDMGRIFATLITLALISSLSAMTIAGPRVPERMGEDYKLFRKMSVKNKNGAPYIAILLQMIISITFVIVASFRELIDTIAITLTLFSLLTVIGVYVLRYTRSGEHRPYKTWGYPVTPLLFIVAAGWMMYSFLKDDVTKVLYSLAIMAPGLIVYYIVRHSRSEQLEQDIEESSITGQHDEDTDILDRD